MGLPFSAKNRGVMKYTNPTLKPCHFKENKSLKITIHLLVVRSLPNMGNLQFTPPFIITKISYNCAIFEAGGIQSFHFPIIFGLHLLEDGQFNDAAEGWSKLVL